MKRSKWPLLVSLKLHPNSYYNSLISIPSNHGYALLPNSSSSASPPAEALKKMQ
jgi:hypothetical protein